MNFQTVSTAEKLPTPTARPAATWPTASPPARCSAARSTTSSAKLGSMLAALDAAAPGQHHDDHPLRQARPVARQAVGADPDPRRPDHRRARTQPGSRPPDATGAAGRLLDRRRRDADLAERPLAGRARASPSSTCCPTADRQRHQRQPEAVHQLRPRAKVYAGTEAAEYFGAAVSDPRVPDLFGSPSTASSTPAARQDRRARRRQPAGPRSAAGRLRPGGAPAAASTRAVETTQIAPTILHLLGLDPGALEAVQIEHTRVLPLR